MFLSVKDPTVTQAQNRGGCNVVFSVVRGVGATKNHGRLVVGRGSMKNDGRTIGSKAIQGAAQEATRKTLCAMVCIPLLLRAVG
jgi:hypothetical protein